MDLTGPNSAFGQAAYKLGVSEETLGLLIVLMLAGSYMLLTGSAKR